MSTSLIILLPVVLLGIVGMLCFVGCILDTKGLPPSPFDEYTNKTVLANNNLMAFWPLSDQKVGDNEPAHAAELMSDNKGNFIDPTTAPTLYPWPSYFVPKPPEPDAFSDLAPGTIAFAQASIVAGDVFHPGDTFAPPACIVVNGCYVEVPWNDKFVPKGSFTVEAWVRPDWTGSDPHGWRFVLDARDLNPDAGFALFAKADDIQPGMPGTYRWAGIVSNGGTGVDGFTFIVGDPIALGTAATPAKPVYLALTYDVVSQTATLFVNPAGAESGTKVTQVPYLPNTNQIRPLWIGAGAPYVPQRPQPQQPPDVPAAPLFPFVGAIQDVAIYNVALSPQDIVRHFDNGTGFDP
jgi:hypothetical protein